MSEMRLTIGERILFHLQKSQRSCSNDFIAPYSITQDGIGESLKISRAHASIELRRMIGKGLVEESFRHIVIDGVAGIKRKSYALTSAGYKEVESLRCMVENTGMTVQEAIIHTPSMAIPREKLRQEVQIWMEKGKQLQRQIEALED